VHLLSLSCTNSWGKHNRRIFSEYPLKRMFPKEWKARPKTFLSVIAGTQNYINFGTIHISVPDIKDKKKKRTLKDLLCLSLYKLRMQVVL
jgi:hypothetical protein